MSTPLRLSDVLARDVALEWFEAVAVTREVADRVLDTVGGQRIPELDQVQLSSEGTIMLSGATKVDEPVRRLGQLLQACLVQCDPPVQLRLAVSQATAPVPGFTSVREFADALAYFERPDRPAVLRGLFARAGSAGALASTVAPTLDAIAPLPAPIHDKPREREPKRPTKSRRPVVAIVAIVTLVVAATAYSQLNPNGPGGPDVSTIALQASDAVGTTLVKGISAVSESVGLGRFVPAEGASAPPSGPATAAPRVTPARAPKAPRAANATEEPFTVFDLEKAAVGLPAPVPPLPGLPPSASPARTEVSEAVVPATVYSADDEDVTAPVGVRPQLPRVLPAGVSKDQLSQIELVILPDGTVGSVKLLGERQSVLEAMLLSAAKAWKFVPAMKNGEAVTYRKHVWIAR